VRKFEDYDWSLLGEGQLVLMTVQDLGDPKSKMSIADFRDVQALFLSKVGKWVGMSPTRGLRFGSAPLKMVNGVWYCSEDVEAQKGHEDLTLSPDTLSLEMIK
jgi:hypothetical protein